MFIKPLKSAASKISGTVSLRTVLIVPFVIQIFGAVGLVGYLSFKNGQEAVNDVASLLGSEISDRIQQYLRNYLDKTDVINQINASAVRLGQLKLQDSPSIERYLWHQIQMFNSVTYIQFGTQNREFIGVERLDNGSLNIEISGKSTGYALSTYATDNNGDRTKLLKVTPNYNPLIRPWYTAPVKAGKSAWSDIYTLFNFQKLAITGGMPLYDNKSTLLGVTGVDLSLSQISEFLHSLKIGRTGKTFIIERSGLLVATSATKQPFRFSNQKLERIKAVDSTDVLTSSTAKYLTSHFQDLSKINSSHQLNFSLDGKQQFLQIVPFQDGKGLNWLVVVVVPESDFMEQINANTRTTIILCIVALIVATVVGIFTAQWITKPILRLNTSAKDIAKGEWDKTVEIERSDELGELAKSFNSMAIQLQESFAKMTALNEELSHSESRLKQFLEALPVGVSVHDATGQLTYANQTAQQLLGIEVLPNTKSEQLANAYQVYIAGSEQLYPTDKLPIVRCLAGENVKIDDMELHKPNKVIPLEVWTTPIFDEKGKIVYAIAAFTDITERKQAEKLLAEYNRTLEIQVQERTQELSQALLNLQITQQELIQSEKMAALGQLIAGVAHEVNTPLGAIRSSIENIADFLTENLEQLPSFLQQLSPENQQYFFALLRKANQQQNTLSSKERRSLKKTLIRQLESHNLKNVDMIADTLVDIGVYDDIEPFLPLLKDSNSENILNTAYKIATLQKSTQTITTATERAAKVVFALKNYARYDSTNEKVQANITQGIETVLTLYQNQLKQGVEVIRNYAELPAILCYPDELNQVWTNLLHNALQAMDNQGILTIEALEQDTNVVISIADSGKGIPPSVMPRIFEPFFTTKPAGEGSGLGLDIVQKIIEKHQGKIEVESVPGKTTFTVSIPINFKE